MNFLPIMTIVTGLWLLVNGILHDIFVLRSEHGREYNRDLLRLLMDGHILITCGIVLLFCYKGIVQHQPWAYWVAITVCGSILVYCVMIFPFLKSIVTTLIALVFLISLVAGLVKL
jgi:hypothetical protein